MRLFLLGIVAMALCSCQAGKNDVYGPSDDVLVWSRHNAAEAVKNKDVQRGMPHVLDVESDPSWIARSLFTGDHRAQ